VPPSAGTAAFDRIETSRDRRRSTMTGTRRTPGRFALGLLIGASALLVWTATAAATPDFTISKTADAEYSVSHTWKATKSAQPAGPITTSGAKADVAYAVAVTRDEVRDWRVTGVITITNTTVFDATNVQITDAISDGGACSLENGFIDFVPAGGVVQRDYECWYVAGPADGTAENTATVAWHDGFVNRTETTTVPVTFPAPTPLNQWVRVTDSLNGGPPVTLAGRIGEDASFTYPATLPVPKAGCATYPNTVLVETVNEQGVPDGAYSTTATTGVRVCRAKGTTPVRQNAVPAGPRAVLRAVKSGPSRAAAGRTVEFRLSVRNTSRVRARGVVLRDLLPQGMVLAVRTGGVRISGRTLTWRVGNVPAGRTVTRTVRVRILSGAAGRICNAMSASASNARLARDSACTTVVRPRPRPVLPRVTG
jgi:uncharacterized repeat protein (TIGR01451 family)